MRLGGGWKIFVNTKTYWVPVIRDRYFGAYRKWSLLFLWWVLTWEEWETGEFKNMKLGKKDVALIFKDTGMMELVLPKMKDDETVSSEALVAVAIMTLLQEGHREFLRILTRTIKKM